MERDEVFAIWQKLLSPVKHFLDVDELDLLILSVVIFRMLVALPTHEKAKMLGNLLETRFVTTKEIRNTFTSALRSRYELLVVRTASTTVEAYSFTLEELGKAFGLSVDCKTLVILSSVLGLLSTLLVLPFVLGRLDDEGRSHIGLGWYDKGRAFNSFRRI